MCADMAFDGTESKLACAAGYELSGGKCVLPTHCGSLEGDKTIATFDSHEDWLNGTYSERNGNISDTGDDFAAHCRPVAPAGCPAGWTTYNNKCYKAGSDITGHTAKWSEARTACESEGAFLVTINDQAENDFVSNDPALCGSSNCWIGGNDLSVEAHASTDASAWQWDNGETSGYSNFAAGHRSYFNQGAGSDLGHGEDCLLMTETGKWHDTGCGIEGRDNDGWLGSINYVCESRLPPAALFSDHEKVRIVATVHLPRVTTSTMHTTWYGDENSWKINGGCSGKCNGYAYRRGGAGDVTERTHDFVLPAGTHELVLEDSWGDGWSGGYLTLAYENGTEFLSTEGDGFGRHGVTSSYECDDDGPWDGRCKKMTIEFTVEPTIINTATLVTDNLKCDWESPPINIDNTGFNQHSIGALDITTNFKEEGHKDSDDSYKVWITACTGLDGGGSCTEDLVHAVYDDTAATAVYHDSVENNGQVNIGEAHKSYKVRVETNAEGVGNKYFINSVSVKAAACTCPQYHHLSDGSCVANTCSCANGAAVANADCTVNGANQCSDCDWFYFKASTTFTHVDTTYVGSGSATTTTTIASCQRASTDEQYAQALDNEQISLKSHHGKYLVAEQNGDANWNRAKVRTWETWSFEWNGGTSVSFKGHHGKYLVAETNGDANANRAVLGDWEKFTIDHISGNKITLRGAHGKYLVAEHNGDANANRNAANGWETFKVFQQ